MTRALYMATQVTYEWRRHEFPTRRFPGGVHSGFIAQEVEEFLPDLVKADGHGWKSIHYVGVVPYLVDVAQQSLARERALQAKVEQQNATLEARTQELQAQLVEQSRQVKELQQREQQLQDEIDALKLSFEGLLLEVRAARAMTA